jgi:hypothetical protein
MNFQYVTRTVFAFALFSQIFSHAETPDWDVDMSIYGFGADSSQVYALKGGMRIGIDAEGQITKSLKYHGKMNIFFEEGSHTSLNNNSYATATTYGIEEANIIWEPSQFFTFKIGVDSVEADYAPLFIDAPSLGLGQVLKIADYDFFEFELFSRQNVVSVNSTQSRTGSVGDKAAYYLLGGFHSKLAMAKINLYIDYNYFSYDKLSAPLAESSRFRGNTVTGTGDSSKYFYEYKGHDISAAIEVPYIFHKMKFFGEYLSNTESKDSGHLVGAKIYFNEKYSIRMDNFKNEPDTLPAISVSPSYGGTNREGQRVGFYFLEGTSEISIDYYKMDTVDTSVYQDDLEIFALEYTLDV